MKIKKLGALLVSAALCVGMAAPAFAFEGEAAPVEQPVLPEVVEEDVVTITDETSGALTPEGNLTLVDDYHTNYSDGSGQQFITLVSKSGSTFYLVIDRNAKGQQTVHFMNLVDEADLLALMEEDAADAYTAEKEAAAQAEQDILAITRTPNKEAPAERYMVQVKSNLAPTGSAILFEVAEKGVDFISEMEMTAEEAFQSLAPKMGRPNEKEIKAKEFLLEMLKDGEMLSSDCEEKLEAAGFKKSTIKKAKKKAGVISRKQGFLWYWSLPMGDIPRE